MNRLTLVILVCLFFIVVHACMVVDRTTINDIKNHDPDCEIMRKSGNYDLTNQQSVHLMIVDTINHENDLHRFTKSKTRCLLMRTRDAVLAGLLATVISRGELPSVHEGIQWSVTAGIIMGISEFVMPLGDDFIRTDTSR